MSFLRCTVVAALVALGVLASSACGITDPSSNKTDTFSGTMGPGFQPNITSFTVSQSGGEYSAEITTLAPDSGATLGLIIAQSSGATACAAIIGNTGFASLNKTALSGPINPGTYCAEIFDNQEMARPEAYTLSVSHP